jgi:hypothetical protein
MGRTISSLSIPEFFRVKSRTLPLLDHGIAMAGTGWPDDVSNQAGHMFGWLNVDHMSSASSSVCDKGIMNVGQKVKGKRPVLIKSPASCHHSWGQT